MSNYVSMVSYNGHIDRVGREQYRQYCREENEQRWLEHLRNKPEWTAADRDEIRAALSASAVTPWWRISYLDGLPCKAWRGAAARGAEIGVWVALANSEEEIESWQ